MFIKGVSHQLGMIASILLFIFYQYIHTHASFNTLVDAEGGPVSGKNNDEQFYCNT